MIPVSSDRMLSHECRLEAFSRSDTAHQRPELTTEVKQCVCVCKFSSVQLPLMQNVLMKTKTVFVPGSNYVYHSYKVGHFWRPALVASRGTANIPGTGLKLDSWHTEAPTCAL